MLTEKEGQAPEGANVEEQTAPQEEPVLVTEEPLAEDLDGGDTTKKLTANMEKFPMREFAFTIRDVGELRFNPLVSFLGMLILWLMAGLCMGFPGDAGSLLGHARAEITEFFTWFIVGTQPIYLALLFFVAYKFGDQKLAPTQDEKPEFSNMSFFAMIFSAGVAVGLFFYGVSEPLWHLDSNFFAQQEFRSEDEKAIMAITYTVHHWGLPAWACYTLVGVTIGLLSYREGLPMTIRSTLHPLLAGHTWGWIGDLIDAFSIVVVVAGVCTSLGLGAIQMSQGLQRLGWASQDLTDTEKNNLYITVIWVVTIVATLSVVSGLNYGIKLLSQAAFIMGTILWFLVLVMDNPWFLLNLIVQETGFYIQYGLFLLNFWTDAFGQLTPGEGRATDGESAAQWFQNAWTIFYLTWWASWATFVGMFIARISRGRTIREVIFYTLFAPLLYVILWFSVFGGAGIRSHRRAQELEVAGAAFYNNKSHFLVPQVNGWDVGCYNPPIEPLVFPNGTVAYSNPNPWQGPVCLFNTAGAVSDAWFNVLFQYGKFGGFLSGLSIFALGIYFVTSSDSGSLVVDHLASNGAEEHHWLQRVFWAVTEGAVATGLLMAGGSNALGALQSLSVIAGLPFNILMCFMCTSLYRTCEDYELKQKGTYRPDRGFKVPFYAGVLNVGEWLAKLGPLGAKYGAYERVGHELPSKEMTLQWFIALFFPFVSIFKVCKQFGSEDVRMRNMYAYIMLITIFVTHFCWIGFFAAVSSPDIYISNGIYAFGWTAFFTQAVLIASVRFSMRERLGFRGNFLEDFFGSCFYPQVLVQMLFELKEQHGEKVHEV